MYLPHERHVSRLQTLISSWRLLLVAGFLGTDLVDPKARAGDFGFGSATVPPVFSTLTSLDSASLLGVCTKLFLIMLMTLGAFSAGKVGTAFSGAIGTLASALLLALGAVDLPKMLDTLPATCSAKLFRGSTLGFGAAMVLIGAFGGMAFATLATGIAGAFLVTGATVCVAAPANSVTLMVGVLETDPAMAFGTTGTTSATLVVGVLDTDTDPVDPVAVCVACVVKAT